jgi:hypothetical protein
MTITNGYATLPEFKAWISESETVIDSILEECVETASRWIDEYCERTEGRRHFYQVTEARVFDTEDPFWVCVDDLVSVTSLKTDDDANGTFETTWAASDYQLLPVNSTSTGRPYTAISALTRNLPIHICGVPRQRVGRIEVTGVWGWSAIPDGVHTACLMVAHRDLKRRHSPEGVMGVGEFTVRISGRVDPDVESLLREFRPLLVA